MALLEKCFCCSLVVAASVIGVYTSIAYVIAFSMEIWWIVQARAHLPSFAYFLCALYFLIFVISGLLLRGLSLRKTLYLLEWLIIITVLSFPEAGLVFFMSVYYRKVHSLYGLTELTCWLCRIIVNIAGVICIQSLYSTWKEEKKVVKNLQGLHMKPLQRPRRVSVISNEDFNGSAAYSNAGFLMGQTSDRFTARRISSASLKRSVSSASQNHPILPRLISSQQYGGSLPYGIEGTNGAPVSPPQTNHPRPASPFIVTPPPAFIEQELKSPSEFNASNFDLVMASTIRNTNNYLNQSSTPLFRTQSMLNLTSAPGDVAPGKAMSMVDYPILKYPLHKYRTYSTHSLDRPRSKTYSSSSDIVNYHSTRDRRLRNTAFRKSDYRPSLLFPSESNTEYMHPMRFYTAYHVPANNFERLSPMARKASFGNDSDDFKRYRDVAL